MARPDLSKYSDGAIAIVLSKIGGSLQAYRLAGILQVSEEGEFDAEYIIAEAAERLLTKSLTVETNAVKPPVGKDEWIIGRRYTDVGSHVERTTWFHPNSDFARFGEQWFSEGHRERAMVYTCKEAAEEQLRRLQSTLVPGVVFMEPLQ